MENDRRETRSEELRKKGERRGKAGEAADESMGHKDPIFLFEHSCFAPPGLPICA